MIGRWVGVLQRFLVCPGCIGELGTSGHGEKVVRYLGVDVCDVFGAEKSSCRFVLGEMESSLLVWF